MTDAAVEETNFGREVRLGLVLYGGVSLAIYMNGTTNELYRAVRGRGVYFLIKHLLNADITVDVASGASAGGINGIFLAFALANGREFGTCADLWRRDGDLGSLLRSADSESVPSVLDSEHYRDILENGFRVMWENETHPEEPEKPSATRELDLFVTGTNFYGHYTQVADSSGRVIETKQHRTLFLLKHRERVGSKCQLDPRRDAYGKAADPNATDAGLLALAKLAQITSCFPGAFAAVQVAANKEGDGTETGDANQKLKVWGKLSVGEHYFVDGGVLDNKPFTSTLDTIFHRPADRRVCRHLLYLEPDPERFNAQTRDKRDGEDRVVAPSFVSSVMDSMTRLPSYESIADDLARIAKHNASIQRFDALVKGLTRNGAPEPSETYYAARLLAIGQRVNDELAEALGSVEFTPNGADGSQKVKLSMDSIGEFLRELGSAIHAVAADEAHPTPEDKRRALLKQLDVDFYIRRLLAFTYVLEAKSDLPNYAALWRSVNHELQLLEIVRTEMERVVVLPMFWRAPKGLDQTLKDANVGDLWAEITGRTLALLDPKGFDEWMGEAVAIPAASMTPEQHTILRTEREAQRNTFRDKLFARREANNAKEASAFENPPHKTLLEVSDQRVMKLVTESGCDEQDFFKAFERTDAVRFPLELAARVHQRDQISVIRLSPFDAQAGLSRRSLEDKICGETFGHFGAFLKKSWRSNDILWGRLDGVCRLVETLLLHSKFSSDDASAESALPPLDAAKLLSALGAPGERRRKLGQLFPHLAARIATPAAGSNASPMPAEHDPLNGLLLLLESQGSNVSGADRARLVAQLTEVAQLDALCEDLPKVIADAAEEQLEWGMLKVDGKLPGAIDPRATSKEVKKAEKAARKAEAKAHDARAQARRASTEATSAEALAKKARSDVPKVRAASQDQGADVSFWLEAWEFRANAGALDASILNLATSRFAREALENKTPSELVKYFRQNYAVGSESAFLAMPSTVLADLGARTVVLAESALVSSGSVGRRLRDNRVYRMVVRWPVWMVAGLAAFLRRSPQTTQSFVVGSVLYALLAIVTNVLYAGSLYEKAGFERTVAIWAFAILPLSAIVGSWLVWRSPWWKRGIVAILGLAAGVLIMLWWRGFFS